MFASIPCLGRVRPAPMFTWACAIAFVVGSACAQPQAAPTTPAGASGFAALEREFGVCDHASTLGLLDFGTAARCSVVTEALRKQRFAGDFTAMRAWWREHKAAQHGALDAALRATRPQGPAARAGA